MNARTTNLKAQGGFTLIEVIAVLVIVGMLAAVAIPKYLDMQTSAAENAVQGAVAAAASNVTMEYSAELLAGDFVDLAALAGFLNNGGNTLSGRAVTPYTQVGDFTASYQPAANGITVSITAAPSPISGQWNNIAAAKKSKLVTLQ